MIYSAEINNIDTLHFQVKAGIINSRFNIIAKNTSRQESILPNNMRKRGIHFICYIILITLFLVNCSIYGNSLERGIDGVQSASETLLLAEVLMHLQLDYVEPEKLDPESLLQGALTELGRTIPEVTVVPELRETTLGSILRISFKTERTHLPVSQMDGLYDLHITLQMLMKRLLQMNPQLTQLKMEQIVVRGILNQLDSYSVLLPKKIYNEFNINIGGKFAGVGLVVGTRDDQLTVIAPMDGSPAALAGMKPLDRIVAVDGEKTEHMTLDEILHRLRGNIGTPVTLRVLRKGHAKALQFELLRQDIQVESVETFDLASSKRMIRYVRIKNFQTGTSRELKNKLGTLNKMDGLILDLRNNPGGLLEEAIRVSDLFLQGKKRIVSTKRTNVSTDHNAKQLFVAEDFLNIPLVLLINRGSASAAEIVAAALKQNKRAIVIGEQSFGKGTVQTLWDLRDGSGLKLTIGEYLTPDGHSIHNVGVVPNLRLIPVSIPELKNQESESGSQEYSIVAKRFGLLPDFDAENRANFLDNRSISYLSLTPIKNEKSEIIDNNLIIDELKADIYVKTADRILSQWNTKKINSVIQKISQEAEQKESQIIKEALAKHGIDWSLNPFIKSATSEMLILTWSAEVISTDLVRLQVKLRNAGKIVAQRLIAVTRASNGILDGLEFPIGKLLPEDTASRTIDVRFPAGMMEEFEPVEILLFDHNFKKLKSERRQLQFFPKRTPSFQLAMKMLDNGDDSSQGNADGKVQSGETIAMRLKIINTGEKIVPELLMKLQGIEGAFRINRGKILLKNLEPQKKQKDYFLFKSLTNAGTLGKISLEMIDIRSGSPGIVYVWDLKDLLPKQKLVTPELLEVSWKDKEGNNVEAETDLSSLILQGKVSNVNDVRDVFVHLNNKKMFYSDNVNEQYGKTGIQDKNTGFNFKTEINLDAGNNNISIFSRSRSGFTSEHRLRIYRRQ